MNNPKFNATINQFLNYDHRGGKATDPNSPIMSNKNYGYTMKFKNSQNLQEEYYMTRRNSTQNLDTQK